LPEAPDPSLERLATLLESEPKPDKVERLAGDASTRVYYRLRYKEGRSAVVMILPTPGGNEEASFLDIQRFLKERDLPVPSIQAHLPEEGLVVLEDLGDELLESVLEGAGARTLRDLYTEAVDILLNMRRKTAGLSAGCVAFDLAFDREKLMWEMHFFVTHFIEGLCQTRPSAAAGAALEKFFVQITGLLADEPRIFTHRDYHARNLILHNGRLVMIDFQDARMGPSQYDLASLLRDSYVTVPDELVEDLLDYYQDRLPPEDRGDRDRFRYVFDIMSLQRNIKALGTFGFQGSVRKSMRYFSAIPRTGSYIAANIRKHPDLAEFRSVVEDLVIGPALVSGSKNTK
jgi:N-acetylmuramate 1-kinase